MAAMMALRFSPSLYEGTVLCGNRLPFRIRIEWSVSLKIPWLQISDLKGWECAAAQIYKIDGIPDNILIDPQGKIIDRGLRGKPLHKRLEQLLNK